MISTKIQLSIPQPCQENWEEMTSVEKGKFCNSCQKKIFDFTNTSDRELINALEKNSSLCGRFQNTQLNRELIKPKEKSSIWIAVTTTFISLLGVNEIKAQEKVKTEQTDNKILNNSVITENEEIEVTGIVLDKMAPLPGVNVYIKGSKTGTQTNFDGEFTINVKKRDILIFNYIGYIDNSIIIENTNKINLPMKVNLNSQVTLGIVCTIKKRTFFSRLFHKNKFKIK